MWITAFITYQMKNLKIVKDDYGIKLKFPERSCEKCKKFPCFPEIDKTSSNFAAYGCIYFKE